MVIEGARELGMIVIIEVLLSVLQWHSFLGRSRVRDDSDNRGLRPFVLKWHSFTWLKQWVGLDRTQLDEVEVAMR